MPIPERVRAPSSQRILRCECGKTTANLRCHSGRPSLEQDHRPEPPATAGRWEEGELQKSLQAVILAFSLTAPPPILAAPADLAGWDAARWGMTTAEIEAAFGARLTTLPGRWIYGGAYAERAVLETRVGGLAFTAYFQMNAESGRLQQVLLERRQQDAANPAVLQALRKALEARFGPASQACLLSERNPTGLELVWRFPTTTLHATFLDFFSTSVLYVNPNVDRDPLRPAFRDRAVRRRTLPRRATLRFHPSERDDLLSRRARCFPDFESLEAIVTREFLERTEPQP